MSKTYRVMSEATTYRKPHVRPKARREAVSRRVRFYTMADGDVLVCEPGSLPRYTKATFDKAEVESVQEAVALFKRGVRVRVGR